MSKKLNFLSDEAIKVIRDREIEGGIDSLKSKISDMDIQVENKTEPAPAPKHTPRYDQEQLSELARKIYRTNIKPIEKVDEAEEKTKEVANTYASRVNAKSLANSLINIRNGGNGGKTTETTANGNGDLGTYTSPGGVNGGDLGGTSGYAAITTTTMTVEEYQEYINKKFVAEEQKEEETETKPQFIQEGSPAVDELEDKLTEMSDLSWQSIDKVMRVIAKEHDMTPKELHKAFKAEHNGMIPDEWAKDNQMTEECGWMPLEEAVALNKVGNVYEVTMMWKGSTKRLKFFWPQVGVPSREEMQEVCNTFYPGCALLAFYLSQDMGDNKDNYMILVAPSTPKAVVLNREDWEPMTSGESFAYEMIVTDEGEPISPPMMTPNGLVVMIEDHDTGEERTVNINSVEGECDVVERYKISSGVFFGEGKRGLWDNIHAKRKRGEKPAKKGDKDYPKTLNVEGLEQAKKNVGADSCWDGYKAKGTKKKNGKEVPNCVKEGEIQEDMSGMSQKSGDKRSTESGAGMTSAGVKKYNSRTGGNLKTAVTTPPSKLKAGSKSANRRKSFCARSRGWNGERGKAARRRWNC